jgi:hypothetical protein
MAGEQKDNIHIEYEVRAAVRDILLGNEGQMLMERVAEEAALHAITDFMLKIGMDTTSAQSILSLQSDMQHLRWWNRLVGSTFIKIVMTLVTLSVVGAYAALIPALKAWMFTAM